MFSCNRKAKNPVDRVKYVLSGHHGPLSGLRRNPFNSKYFLSIGRIWARYYLISKGLLPKCLEQSRKYILSILDLDKS